LRFNFNIYFTETLNKIIFFRHREYYKTKKCILRCDKNEIPVADFYRTIEEHVALKGRLDIIQVFGKKSIIIL